MAVEELKRGGWEREMAISSSRILFRWLILIFALVVPVAWGIFSYLVPSLPPLGFLAPLAERPASEPSPQKEAQETGGIATEGVLRAATLMVISDITLSPRGVLPFLPPGRRDEYLVNATRRSVVLRIKDPMQWLSLRRSKVTCSLLRVQEDRIDLSVTVVRPNLGEGRSLYEEEGLLSCAAVQGNVTTGLPVVTETKVVSIPLVRTPEGIYVAPPEWPLRVTPSALQEELDRLGGFIERSSSSTALQLLLPHLQEIEGELQRAGLTGSAERAMGLLARARRKLETNAVVESIFGATPEIREALLLFVRGKEDPLEGLREGARLYRRKIRAADERGLIRQNMERMLKEKNLSEEASRVLEQVFREVFELDSRAPSVLARIPLLGDYVAVSVDNPTSSPIRGRAVVRFINRGTEEVIGIAEGPRIEVKPGEQTSIFVMLEPDKAKLMRRIDVRVEASFEEEKGEAKEKDDRR